MTDPKLKRSAEELASKGRYGDSMLVHMNPLEVQALARMSPVGLSINPDTGQPEAFLPFIAALLGGAGAAALPATLATTAAAAAPAAAAAALPALAAPTLAATALPAAEIAATAAAPAAAGLGALEAAAPALTAAEAAAAIPGAAGAAAPQQLAAMGLGEMGGFQAAQQAGAIAAPLPAPIDPAMVPGVPTGPSAPFGPGPNSPLSIADPIPNTLAKSDPLMPLTPQNMAPPVDPMARIPTSVDSALPKMDAAIPQAPTPPPITSQPTLTPPPEVAPPPEVQPYAGPSEVADLQYGGPQDITPTPSQTIDEAVYGAAPPAEAAAPAGSDFSLSSITSSPFFLPGLLAGSSLISSAMADDGGKKDDDEEAPPAEQPAEGDYTAQFPDASYVPGRDDEHNYFPDRSFADGGGVGDTVKDFVIGSLGVLPQLAINGDLSDMGLGGVASLMKKKKDDKYADGGYIDPRDRVSMPDSGYRPGTDPAHNYFPQPAMPEAKPDPGVNAALQALADQNAADIKAMTERMDHVPTGDGAGGHGGTGDDGGASHLADGGVVTVPFSYENATVSSGGGPSMAPNPLGSNTQAPFTMGDAMAPAMPQNTFAAGGAVQEPMMGPLSGQDPRIMLMAEAEKAIAGQHPDPEAVLQQFVQTFGQGALRQLAAGAQHQQQGEAGRMIDGPGGPRSDDVPARIDNTHEAALSDGEFVMTADAVRNIGGGDPMKGAQILTMMNEQLGGRNPTGQVDVTKVR